LVVTPVQQIAELRFQAGRINESVLADRGLKRRHKPIVVAVEARIFALEPATDYIVRAFVRRLRGEAEALESCGAQTAFSGTRGA
jgi:hypothetical protein